jgi:hypothetical protein
MLFLVDCALNGQSKGVFESSVGEVAVLLSLLHGHWQRNSVGITISGKGFKRWPTRTLSAKAKHAGSLCVVVIVVVEGSGGGSGGVVMVWDCGEQKFSLVITKWQKKKPGTSSIMID